MSADRLIEAYLNELATAAEALPAERLTELIADMTTHIAEARADGATSEDDVRAVLQRLGDPRDIVEAATDGLVQVDVPPRFRLRDFGAVALLLIGPFALVIGWLAGVWLLWTSDRWTRGEKLLATLGWPIGYGVAVVCDWTSIPLGLTLAIAAAITVAPLIPLLKNGQPGRSATRTRLAGATPATSSNR
ncbi:hypothetical protein GCM10029976_057440 [Kribbella albertanoniae]|uniref:DUF1700 domain-containing protein n=1 Tax=Kribbella albertanoniae TaxID=1266829 RepID=A0A4R4P3P8_9ACTN|nr:hypothetical protein [Kribbella albertanoniae]TDC16625.1 hypothetical protein E1261_38560 [Kribbella albertanoniae]